MDIVDRIADCLVENHVALLAENESLRQQLVSVTKERDEIAAQARMLDRMVDERDDQLASALAACEAKDDCLLDCAGNINPERGPFSRDHNNGLQHAIDIIRELKECK